MSYPYENTTPNRIGEININGPSYNLVQLKTDRIFIPPKPQHHDFFCNTFDNLIYVFFAR